MFSLNGLLNSFNGFIKRVNSLNWSVRKKKKTRKLREVTVVRIKNSPQILRRSSTANTRHPEHFLLSSRTIGKSWYGPDFGTLCIGIGSEVYSIVTCSSSEKLRSRLHEPGQPGWSGLPGCLSARYYMR